MDLKLFIKDEKKYITHHSKLIGPLQQSSDLSNVLTKPDVQI